MQRAAGNGCQAARPLARSDGHFDAPFQPTPPAVVTRMVDLAAVGAGTCLVDLGCGNGRIVTAAARRGAIAIGIDIDRERIAEAAATNQAAGFGGKARFVMGTCSRST